MQLYVGQGDQNTQTSSSQNQNCSEEPSPGEHEPVLKFPLFSKHRMMHNLSLDSRQVDSVAPITALRRRVAEFQVVVLLGGKAEAPDVEPPNQLESIRGVVHQ